MPNNSLFNLLSIIKKYLKSIASIKKLHKFYFEVRVRWIINVYYLLLTVFSESDDFEHFSVPLEDGVQHVENYRVQHVLYDDA